MSPLIDVAVIGSGHNALVAACYLARAGLSVEVFERDTVAGGAVSTVERFPGHRVDRGSSAHVMIRHSGIVEDLDLAGVGLRYLDCDPFAFHPVAGAPGGGITFSSSLTDTCESIAAVCGERDAEAYAAFVQRWAPRARRMLDAFAVVPTPANLGRRLWRLGAGSGAETARELLGTGDALLDATYHSEPLKTALSWLGAQSGPPTTEVGSAALVAWNAVLHGAPPGRPVGGSGALSTALVARLESLGGRVRLGSAVTGIEGDRHRVTGLRLATGESVRARRVLAGCHVLTTVGLLGDAIPSEVAERARRCVQVGNGIGMVLRLSTTAPPAYPGASAQVHHGLGLVAPDRIALRRAHGQFMAGELPSAPAVLPMTFSVLDPSLAPAGRHVVNLWAQWYPYRLSGGCTWAGERERAAAAIIDQVEQAAPGFAESIRACHIQTPADLEDELGLLAGNVMHVEMTLPAMFGLRPLPEWSGYRGPLPGLYLTGASTHPGGGVSGMSGRSAAQVILAEAASRTGSTRRAAAAAAAALWQ